MAEITTIRYVRFFEVRVLHEFYLNTNSNRSYFSLGDAARNAYLNTLLFNNRYDIWNDLSIEPSKDTRKLLHNLNCRFVKTKTGFLVGIKVKSLTDRTHPFIAVGGAAPLVFHIKISNPYFKNFTNLSMNSVLPSVYFFSNINGDGAKIFPSLSLPIGQFAANKTYEQGEVAELGTDIMEAVKRTNSAATGNWRKITARGIAHEGDRILLPSAFWYRFEKDSDVRQASFTLKTTGGTGLKTVQASGNQALRNVMLDFRVDDSSKDITKGNYLVDVSGDNGYFRQEKVMLDPEEYNSQDLGLVEIRFNTGDADFDLFETDGSLKVPVPVFEIRLKSRISYWRYRSNSGKKLNTTAKTNPYLTVENDALKSINPVPMNAMPLEFVDDNPMIPAVFLPNPPGNSVYVENDGDVFSDIFVSGIKDLIDEVL
jgi:hypothetical protein